MKFNLNRILNNVVIPAALILIMSSCSNTFRQPKNLSKTDIYLQCVNLEDPSSTTYGVTEETPIVLKMSSDYGYDLIFEGYIKRLWKSSANEGKLRTYNIVEKSKIPFTGEFGRSRKLDEYEKYIFVYKIESEDGKEEKTLYFRLSSKNMDFYRPNGFAYSMLTG